MDGFEIRLVRRKMLAGDYDNDDVGLAVANASVDDVAILLNQDRFIFGDADCNTIIEITDAVYSISYVFVPGSPPPCDTDNDGKPDC